MSFSMIKRGFSTTTSQNAIKNITIIGGGLMGSGIAQVSAQTGHNVTLVEVSKELLEQGQKRIETSLKRVAKKLHSNENEAEKFVVDVQGRIKGTTDIKASVKDSDLVIEAIVEDLNKKHQLFKTLDAEAPAKTLFASNTSSLSISEIASVTSRKDRFGGLHFFNPVPVMKLLEIVRTTEMSDETYQSLISWGKAIGKTCITCKDTPGFVVNRLLVPFIAEAVRMLERGDATAEDIDTAMKLGAGHPMGPFELADYVGHDTTNFILKGWSEKYPDIALFKPPAVLEKLVQEGKLGTKSGEGFYNYRK